MSKRGLALAAAAVGSSAVLAACGALPGGGGGDSGGQKEAGAGAQGGAGAGWEKEFPKGVTPIIEIDKPGGKTQEEALGEFFALYGDLFTAVYEKDADPAFLKERFSNDAPSPETLGASVQTFVEAGAVPKGEVRFYNGLVGAYTQDTVQVDFCVDQRMFKVQDAETGKEVEVGGPTDWEPDMLKPGIVAASGIFEKGDDGTWTSGSFSIDPQEEGDTAAGCMGEGGGSGSPEPEPS
ncbi:hypothetical protein CLV63_103285 [Murinocardiopsis flavida]|uniref:Lipoprotein n=1 Tax=Murinocardiopsis flavida TaxID=645275 RepID=A0A2P8DQT7_9ACTN|nr:hypothetical protein [Murinocardiopsis flavida]PSK99560.1 hypothetical protein CLV63_103285 [Murinocardiopsis flavida]